METYFSESAKTKSMNIILKHKRQLEAKLKIKIETEGNKILLLGEEVDKYLAREIIDAITSGFEISIALLLLDPNYMMEEIPIKNFTKKKDLTPVKARIIGTKGKTLALLSELSDCHLTLCENIVRIIGPFEKIKDCMHAVKNLISGSKQANVYAYLEKARTLEKPEGLSIREDFLKKK